MGAEHQITAAAFASAALMSFTHMCAYMYVCKLISQVATTVGSCMFRLTCSRYLNTKDPHQNAVRVRIHASVRFESAVAVAYVGQEFFKCSFKNRPKFKAE